LYSTDTKDVDIRSENNIMSFNLKTTLFCLGVIFEA